MFRTFFKHVFNPLSRGAWRFFLSIKVVKKDNGLRDENKYKIYV